MISVQGMKKSFGSNRVLEDVSFEVGRGDVIAVIGSSGSGKSTMLRCLIDLERMDGGTVRVGDRYLIRDGAYPRHSQVREVTSRMGMVFQSFNLFPHMTVGENLIMPYRLVKKADRAPALALCQSLLAKVGLEEKMCEYPATLSGGQKQRVAIARALMLSPEILLFDEPTSALDPEITGEVLQVMKRMAEEHHTMLVVTHELAFARDVASRVLFMAEGRILESGAPEEIFRAPKHPRTASFLRSILG